MLTIRITTVRKTNAMVSTINAKKLVSIFGGRTALHKLLSKHGVLISIKTIEKWMERKSIPLAKFMTLSSISQKENGISLDINDFLLSERSDSEPDLSLPSKNKISIDSDTLFSSSLKIKLKEKGWRAIDLSRATGIGSDTLSRYLSGKVRPSIKNRERIAAAINCSPPEQSKRQTTLNNGIEISHASNGRVYLKINDPISIEQALMISRIIMQPQ